MPLWRIKKLGLIQLKQIFFNPNKFSHKLGLFQNFKLFFFFFDLILGIILIPSNKEKL